MIARNYTYALIALLSSSTYIVTMERPAGRINAQERDESLQELIKQAQCGLECNIRLLKAAAVGDFKEIELAIGERAALNVRLQSCIPLRSPLRLQLAGGPPIQGCTPLHLAARSGAGDAVQLLLEKGADIEAQDFGSVTPLDDACLKRTWSVVRILLRHGASYNGDNLVSRAFLTQPLVAAVLSDDFWKISEILNKGSISLDQVKEALIYAVAQERERAVRMLVEHLAGMNQSSLCEDALTWLSKLEGYYQRYAFRGDKKISLMRKLIQDSARLN
jgi:ankyrin repeat protein